MVAPRRPRLPFAPVAILAQAFFGPARFARVTDPLIAAIAFPSEVEGHGAVFGFSSVFVVVGCVWILIRRRPRYLPRSTTLFEKGQKFKYQLFTVLFAKRRTQGKVAVQFLLP